jgi:hypothetical protein
MNINVRRNGDFIEVSLTEEAATINLGLLDANERDALAEVLIEAVYQMGPIHLDSCNEWFRAILKRQNILLQEEAAE